MKNRNDDPLELLALPEAERDAALSTEIAVEVGRFQTGWLNLHREARRVLTKWSSGRPDDAIWALDAEKLSDYLLKGGIGIQGISGMIPINRALQSVHGIVLNWGRHSKTEVMRAAAHWAAIEWEKQAGRSRRRTPNPQTALAELVAFRLRRSGRPVGDVAEAINRACDTTHDDSWVRNAVRRTRRRIKEGTAAFISELDRAKSGGPFFFQSPSNPARRKREP